MNPMPLVGFQLHISVKGAVAGAGITNCNLPAAVQGGIKVYSVLIGPEVVPPSQAASHDLNRSSRMTGGQFFQANESRTLGGIYNLIDQLEKRELIQKRYVAWRELYQWPAGAGSAFLLGGILITEVLRRRSP
jgi:Ca-activated chloride channel family protein